jgi:hypothetical protein
MSNVPSPKAPEFDGLAVAGGEEGAGVRGAVRAAPKDFEGQAIIEAAGNGPSGDGDPDELAGVVGSAHGELAADSRQQVPVMLKAFSGVASGNK